jgi:hypothetical protein
MEEIKNDNSQNLHEHEKCKLLNQHTDWLKRLIDLTKRNKLIHLAPSARTTSILTIVDELPWQILQHLSSRRRKFTFLPNDNVNKETDKLIPIKHDVPIFKPDTEIPEEEKYSDDQLQTNLSSSKLDTVLTNIMRRSKSAMEEQGYNTLYLSLGTLRWFERDDSEKEMKSPILLLPVELVRKSIQSSFELKAAEDSPILNPALIQKLAGDGHADLGPIQVEIESEDFCDLMEIFRKIYFALKSKIESKRWEIRNDVFLGLFSFSKLAMYRDLKDHEEHFLNNPLVQRLCLHERNLNEYAETVREVNKQNLDNINTQELHPVKDADATQLKAIVA